MKKTKLKLAQEMTQEAICETNKEISELGIHSENLCDELNKIQDLFDEIRNIPSDKKMTYENLKKIRLNWEQQAEKIEKDYKKMFTKDVGSGAVGVGIGVATVALGPAAAMGIATSFGVASTGTAISALSGAAATNAALAWLGGGAIAVGGGGMVAGHAFLALAGPVGFAIAGVSLATSGLLLLKNSKDKKKIENIFTLISERDTKSYELAIVELRERKERIKNELILLNEAILEIKMFGTDYESMSEEQQYKLGVYLNLMNSSTQLLVNPIKGLTPKFDDNKWNKYIVRESRKADFKLCNEFKSVIIALCNLLYKIKIDESDKKLLLKLIRKNEEMLDSLGIKKKEFTIEIIDAAEEALSYNF